MEDEDYNKLKNYDKIMNQKKLVCAPQGKQVAFNGHAIFKSTETFKVYQNRRGHNRPDTLTYVLMHKASEQMIRIDLIGATHESVPTPHIHIFDEAHNNGFIAIPLSELENYSSNSNIQNSLAEFLKYNNFDIHDINISEALI